MSLRGLVTATALSLLSAVVTFTSPSHASEKKVLFVADASSPFSARVRAEIEAMGFVVEQATSLEQGTSAVAAARVLEGSPRRIELWIADTTHHLILRTLVTPGTEDDEASQTVRASEQLRAFFQPLREPTPPAPPPSQPPTQPPIQPPPVVAQPASPPPAQTISPPIVDVPRSKDAPRVVVGAEIAVPFQPGGPGVDLGVRGRWMALAQLGFGGFLDVPVASSTVTGQEGSAALSATLFGAEATYTARPISALAVEASAGLALAWVRTSGFAATGFQGKSADALRGLPIFGLALSPRLAERVHLCLGGHLGFTLSRLDIRFADRPVATWGRPLGVASLGVNLDL
jgi:hypothetical protein